jgi:hypothetical protein
VKIPSESQWFFLPLTGYGGSFWLFGGRPNALTLKFLIDFAEGLMRSSSLWCAALVVMAPVLALAQGTRLSVQQAIEAKYAVSKPTADRKDVVTAGAVIDLTKDNLLMYGTDAQVVSNVTYKGGKFESSGISKFQNFNNRFAKLPGGSGGSSNRTFVAGEKFFLIGVDVKDDGAVLEFLSDPISDLRYKAFVKYPFPTKGAIPAPDVVLGQIAETIKAEPVDAQGGGDQGGGQQQAPAAPAAPAPAPMAAIPPPPPPTDAPAAAPQSISLGQTKDQVVAIMGQPTKVANVGTKEIDTYPDLKVTYIKGKVTDVQ